MIGDLDQGRHILEQVALLYWMATFLPSKHRCKRQRWDNGYSPLRFLRATIAWSVFGDEIRNGFETDDPFVDVKLSLS